MFKCSRCHVITALYEKMRRAVIAVRERTYTNERGKQTFGTEIVVERPVCAKCAVDLAPRLAPELKTSAEWEKMPEFKDITILDPDGWDRKNYQYSFYEEKIPIEEFRRRLAPSTCIFRGFGKEG